MTNPRDLTCQQLETELREALGNLYDPDYCASAGLCAFFGCDAQEGTPLVRRSILNAIEDLRPPAGTPITAYASRMYALLNHRFVLGLTQEETADRLSVSRRTVNRLQHRAIHMLADHLWECQAEDATGQPTAATSEQPRPASSHSGQADDWQSQMQQELASLQRQAPDAVCDIRAVIENTLAFLSHLTTGLGAPVDIVSIQPGLVAQVHPVIMQQLLIAVIQRLTRHASGALLSLYARLEDGDIRITLAGPVSESEGLTTEMLTHDLPIPGNATLEACMDRGYAYVWIQAPSQGKVTVLVVDDNRDMARFYRDVTIGTHYRITSLTTGRELLKWVENNRADIIVLDVMLPDIDGWRLLMRLREDTTTRSVPVIVCSVIREEALAMSLGAAVYLAKPVRPREFIQALNRVSPWAPGAGPTP